MVRTSSNGPGSIVLTLLIKYCLLPSSDVESQYKMLQEPQQVIDDEHTSSSKQFIVELTDEKSTDLLCPDRTNVSVTVALLTAPHRPDEGSCSKSMASSVDVTYGIAQHCVTGNICSIAATKNDLANAAGHAGFGRLMVAYECKRWPPGGTDGSSSSAETVSTKPAQHLHYFT